MINTHSINIALPQVARHFAVDVGLTALVPMAYMAMPAGLILVFGRLCDQIGLKRIFLPGYLLFILAALCCGLAPSLNALIAARALQGIGGTMLITAGTAIIASHIPTARRGWAFGIQGAFSAAGVVIGAPLGGLLAQMAGWRWVFLINLPLCLPAAILAYRFLPAERSAQALKRVLTGFDYVGAAASFAGLLLALYGINAGRRMGWSSPTVILCLAGGAVLMALFIWHELRRNEPLLDLSLFKNRAFTSANLAGLAGFMLMTGNNFLLPFYLAGPLQLSTAATGLAALLFPAVFLTAVSSAGSLSDRVHPARLSMLGMLGAAGACLAFALTLGRQGLTPALIFILAMGLAFALFTAPNNNLTLSLAPRAKAGAAAAILRAAMTIGNVSGLAAFAAVYDHNAAGAITGSMAVAGFRRAYLFGALLCAAASLLSWFAGFKSSDCRPDHNKDAEQT